MLGLPDRDVAIDAGQEPVASLERRQWDTKLRALLNRVAQSLLHFEPATTLQILERRYSVGGRSFCQQGSKAPHVLDGLRQRATAERLDGQWPGVFERNPEARGDLSQLAHDSGREQRPVGITQKLRRRETRQTCERHPTCE